VERSLYAFNARHPSWQAAMLDKSFLQDGAAPVLADFVNQRGALPDARGVAEAWARQFSGTVPAVTVDDAADAVIDLLQELERQLAMEKALQQFLDRHAWDKTALNTERIAREVATLNNEARQQRIVECLNALSTAALTYEAAAEALARSDFRTHAQHELQARIAFAQARLSLIGMAYPGADMLIARVRDLVLDPFGDVIDCIESGGDAAESLDALGKGVTAFQRVLDEELVGG
jgi:hypothetical protein